MYKTDLLFPRTNFVVGMGSVLNVAGNYFKFNYSESDVEADVKALESDWGAVGKDIESARLILKKNTKTSTIK